MKLINTSERPAIFARERLCTLLLGFFFILAVFATAFHTHENTNKSAVHHSCGFCHMVQAGGLTSSSGPKAGRLVVTAPPCPYVSLPVLTWRTLEPLFLVGHHFRAPPLL